MTSSKRWAREHRQGHRAGIDPVTDEQRHAATAVVLARVDQGSLDRAGARELLEMLGVLDADQEPSP